MNNQIFSIINISLIELLGKEYCFSKKKKKGKEYILK